MIPPCWILCHPRTGSTLLCDLLNFTGKFPPFDHPKLVGKRAILEKGYAFGEWMRVYADQDEILGYPPPHLKCLHELYEPLLGWPSRPHIDFLLPGVKYVLLERRNVYEQAVSEYFARTTKKWHVYSEQEQRAHAATPVPLVISDLKDHYRKVANYYPWRRFLGDAPYHTVHYEDMVADPAGTLAGVLNFIGVPTDTVGESVAKVNGPDKRFFRMTRPEAPVYAKLLKAMVEGKSWA